MLYPFYQRKGYKSMARPKKEQPNRANGQYEVKVIVGTDIHGKPIRKSFYSSISKADARRKGEQYRIDSAVALQTAAEVIDHTITFVAWAEKWLEVYVKPTVSENTYKFTYENTVRNHLLPYFGEFRLTAIKPINVQKFFATKKDSSVSMLKKMRMCLSGMFESAIENQVCRPNPPRKTKFTSDATPHEKYACSDEQIDFLKSFALSNGWPEVALLLETGMRRGELLGLMYSDIDFAAQTYSVNRSLADVRGVGVVINPPKKDSYRTNPLSQAAIDILSAIPRRGLYVFPSRKDGLQSPNAWAKRLAVFMAKVHALRPDLPVLTAHDLRHSYGTKLRRDGVDIYTIAKIMGHKDINVTANIYVHNEIDELRKALNFDHADKSAVMS